MSSRSPWRRRLRATCLGLTILATSGSGRPPSQGGGSCSSTMRRVSAAAVGAGGEVEGRLAGGGWRLTSPGGRRGVLPGQVLQGLVSRSPSTFGPGQGSTALRAAGHRSAPRRTSDVVGGAVLRRDQVLSRSSHMETWILFLRGRCCDTRPRVHATVNEGFWTNLLRFST